MVDFSLREDHGDKDLEFLRFVKYLEEIHVRVLARADHPLPVEGSVSDYDIFNHVVTAGSEASHTFSDGTYGFILKARKLTKMRIAKASGETSTKYVTIPQGSPFCLFNLKFIGKEIFFRTENNNIIEIIELK